MKFKTMNMYFTWSCWIKIDVDVSTELFKVKTAFIGILGKLQFCISLFAERINGVNEKTSVRRSIGLDQLKKILSGKSKKGAFENINQIVTLQMLHWLKCFWAFCSMNSLGLKTESEQTTGNTKPKASARISYQLLAINGSEGVARSGLGPLMIYMSYMPIYLWVMQIFLVGRTD